MHNLDMLYMVLVTLIIMALEVSNGPLVCLVSWCTCAHTRTHTHTHAHTHTHTQIHVLQTHMRARVELGDITISYQRYIIT